MGNRILVVDDEKEIADVIELYLKNEGFEVEKFYTGKDALVSIEKAAPDLALLDVMLPDIDGFTILKKIREKYTFPVIMLTAKTEYIDKIIYVYNGITFKKIKITDNMVGTKFGQYCPSRKIVIHKKKNSK